MTPNELPRHVRCIHCGGQAELDGTERCALTIDRMYVDVQDMPAYRCFACHETEVWAPQPALNRIRLAIVATILRQRALSADRVLFLRKTMGLSQEEFARALGLGAGRSLISRYESGRRPHATTLQAIARLAELWFISQVAAGEAAPFSLDPFDYSVGAEEHHKVALQRPIQLAL